LATSVWSVGLEGTAAQARGGRGLARKMRRTSFVAERVPKREEMVEALVARGIHDPRVLEAFRAVPREAFLPPDLREFAYADTPLPIE
jgi:hypothetical protein